MGLAYLMGFQTFLHQSDTPKIVGLFVQPTWQNNSKCYTRQSKLLSNFYSADAIYKCGREQHNTMWPAGRGLQNHGLFHDACDDDSLRA